MTRLPRLASPLLSYSAISVIIFLLRFALALSRPISILVWFSTYKQVHCVSFKSFQFVESTIPICCYCRLEHNDFLICVYYNGPNRSLFRLLQLYSNYNLYSTEGTQYSKKMSSFQLNKLVRVESFINLSPVPFLPRIVIIFFRLYQKATIFCITFVCIVYLGLHTALYLLF